MYSGIDTSVNVKEWVEPAGVDMGVELKGPEMLEDEEEKRSEDKGKRRGRIISYI